MLVPSSTVAASSSVKISTREVSLIKGQTFTLQGNLPSGTKSLAIEYRVGSKWKPLKSKTLISGTKWLAQIKVPSVAASVSMRPVTPSVKGTAVKFATANSPKISAVGPGKRILGVDISRWQHSTKSINFVRMKSSGVAFVIIKASDGQKSEDDLAKPLVLADTKAAKKAGLYVGFYHRARVPSSNTISTLKTDAVAEARLAANRLKQLGGYSDTTFPYVIDIEGVSPRVRPESVTLWLTTWITTMKQLTKRSPTVYSYRNLLANQITKDTKTVSLLRNSHLWLAQPGNPSDPKVLVGKKVTGSGCFSLPWTFGTCSLPWTMWQYTNKGDREKYGIPWSPSKGKCSSQVSYCVQKSALGRYHLDLNVFNGNAADLAAYARGTLINSVVVYR